MKRTPEEVRGQFEKKVLGRVTVDPTTDCWVYTGGKASGGYGTVYLDGINVATHRASYLYHNNIETTDLHVLHTCDNPPCCNPAHLFLGTHADNMRDMVRKGRLTKGDHKGEAHGMATLTNEAVSLIYCSVEQDADLAITFNVHKDTIGRVRNGAAWSHITEKLDKPPSYLRETSRSGLTNTQVLEIYTSDKTTRELMALYSISKAKVNCIRRKATRVPLLDAYDEGLLVGIYNIKDTL